MYREAVINSTSTTKKLLADEREKERAREKKRKSIISNVTIQ